ncbi:MAG: hypothetical protein JWN43_1923 [Gammaproteobacteria bacterium]|nr:hypothetical protein [Gammaproteobacteria bacterium]
MVSLPAYRRAYSFFKAPVVDRLDDSRKPIGNRRGHTGVAPVLDVTLLASADTIWSRRANDRRATAAPVIAIHILNKPPFGERHDGTSGDNKVIENSDVDETQGIAEP